MLTDFDRLSYALGMSMGHNFKASGIEKINSADFAAGVAAVYEGAQPRISYDEAKDIIREYFTALEAKQQEVARKMASVNAEAGKAFLAEKPSGRRWPCVHATGTLYAGYPHFHFYANPAFAANFLAACRKEKHRHA